MAAECQNLTAPPIQVLSALDHREAVAVVKQCASPAATLAAAWRVFESDPAEARRLLEVRVLSVSLVLSSPLLQHCQFLPSAAQVFSARK